MLNLICKCARVCVCLCVCLFVEEGRRVKLTSVGDPYITQVLSFKFITDTYSQFVGIPNLFYLLFGYHTANFWPTHSMLITALPSIFDPCLAGSLVKKVGP